MNYRQKLLVLLILGHSLSLNVDAIEIPIYKNSKAPVELRVEDLLKRMTVEEKILQLNQYTLGRNSNENNKGKEVDNLPSTIGSVIYFEEDVNLRNQAQKKAMEQSRLGIPIVFGFDVIHGFRTVYPISLAQACSWNPQLVKDACSVAAKEARRSGVEWTFSPMIDVARDGRWGRVSEGYGEDPYTNSVFCVASVEGYQGDTISNLNNVAACLKHYIAYGASEAGRDYVYTEVSNQTLWDTYMPPYEAGVKAGAATLMSSFNDISGTPASANHYTLTEVLKEKWAYDGLVVSDWASVPQLIDQGHAENRKEAARLAINAGLDMDMMGRCYDKYLEELLNEGKVLKESLDDAVRRVLRFKFRLGLFDNPYIEDTAEEDRFLLPQSMAVAERLAEETIVLLKNESQILPLKNSSIISVMGPLLDNSAELLGNWQGHGHDEDVISIKQSLDEEFDEKTTLQYFRGCDFDGVDESQFGKAFEIAKQSDVIVLFMGEKRKWSGENTSRSIIELPSIQEKFIEKIAKSGKPIVLVLANGRPLALERIEPFCDAIVEMWQPGIIGGKPIAGVLSGRVNPSGKLSITFPRSTGQIPIYYNQRKTARPHQGKYQDIASTPLYEFGHGLSYTTYSYGPLRISNSSITADQSLVVEVDVKNAGECDGEEAVLWYISDPYSTITRPKKELKHFEKRLIKKGETLTYRFEVNPIKDLSFVDSKGNKFLEKGEYHVIVNNQKITFTIH